MPGITPPPPSGHPSYPALQAACTAVGLDPTEATPVRLAENAVWRLPGGIIARVTATGEDRPRTARLELDVAHWLRTQNIPAIYPTAGIDQPYVTPEGRAVTWWEELPPHVHGQPREIAQLLTQLHRSPVPNWLPPLDPLPRIRTRLADAHVALEPADRRWLLSCVDDLGHAWAELPAGMPLAVLHGDAWGGNVASTPHGAYLLDLDGACVGPPEWDLTSTAVKYTGTGAISRDEYHDFAHAYGQDVTDWPGYPILATARKLRMIAFAGAVAAQHPHARSELRYRIDCLRGHHGPAPWRWTAVP
ncbi:phosphotransferase family protein [Streptomyces xiamenensis]|uniref:phosphotransferase family protein n=1 Tax=Streptomyces xiamenensis TaxID=408015 RepID=UPI0035DBDB69